LAHAVCQIMLGTLAESPLQLAVDEDNKNIVELLLQTPGCQVDRVSSRRNVTPLIHAASTGSIIIVP